MVSVDRKCVESVVSHLVVLVGFRVMNWLLGWSAVHACVHACGICT